jgi:hypothetical protein
MQEDQNMVEGWRRNAELLFKFMMFRLGNIAAIVLAFSMGFIGRRYGTFDQTLSMFMILLAVNLVIIELAFMPWFKRKVKKNASKYMKTYQLNHQEAMARFEGGLKDRGVTYKEVVEGRAYHVFHGDTEMEVVIWSYGANTTLYVDPSEEDWTMDPILQLMDDVML